MHNRKIAFAALQLLTFAAAHEYEFFRWNTPGADVAANVRRQSPPPGYHPEFGSCGSGTTCENACGPNWISCDASTTLSLFCYNQVDLNQTCCENGSGRACESGYYCAWQEFGGRVWCCENGQSLEECGLPSTATTASSPGSPGSSSTSSGSGSSTSGTSGGTVTVSESSLPTCSHYQGSTVTSWATTTVISTISFEVTVTAGEGCSSSPSSRSSGSGTITEPPASSSTSHRPPLNATSSTSSLVTAGTGGLRADFVTLGLAVLGLLCFEM
ncbi:hypothetical protein MFIFM68171_08644 [Madurella fahalii]|uniref:Uncharacterized protein n=1 Tax=Madurella fahalii TaxID=1157608 RepID=A0ABQ0GL58_9PEZI